ncbi:MAG: YfiR family protein [Gemmatimonadetes bacterium]|jgi:hypothetical protein|nr:YfiR family protein [Gemmatimonadota bacterium]MBT4608568.1 YfiR family protein [Gemmatimonadota bacterium]MBT5059232.1 YfiR family protein [Gemmatimonadota bacterium]MBT5145482.1 YfiR family protein [Gemmatimonadota bacterium]MBT5591670.1 YfiR family protein [Gemmatimonadota bacterium]
MIRRRCLCLCLLLLPHGLWAQGTPTEFDVKAVFLYNFARFAEWPKETVDSSQLTICVLGDAPFGNAFDEVVGRTVRKQTIAVNMATSVAAIDSCHLLFVTDSEQPRWQQILAEAGKRSVLTVGEGEAFVQAGGAIGFVIRKKKVRFLINPAAAEKAGIRISSRLLRVAEIYRGQD